MRFYVSASVSGFHFWLLKCECRMRKYCSSNNKETTTGSPLSISSCFHGLNVYNKTTKGLKTKKMNCVFIFPSTTNK